MASVLHLALRGRLITSEVCAWFVMLDESSASAPSRWDAVSVASCLEPLVLMLRSCGVMVGSLGATLIVLLGDVRPGVVLLTELELSKLYIWFKQP